jgi:hypothetical protein
MVWVKSCREGQKVGYNLGKIKRGMASGSMPLQMSAVLTDELASLTKRVKGQPKNIRKAKKNGFLSQPDCLQGVEFANRINMLAEILHLLWVRRPSDIFKYSGLQAGIVA